MKPWRWQPDAAAFVILVSLANVALYHAPLYRFTAARVDLFTFNGATTLLTLLVAVYVVTAVVLFCASLVSRRLLKATAMVMALGNSIAVYFMDTYQAVLDKTMMGNVFTTDRAEVVSYLHPKLLLYFLLLGVLPCVLLAKFRIRTSRPVRTALHALATLIAGVGWIYLASGTWLWIDKNAKQLGGMVMPWSYVANAVRYQSSQLDAPEPIRLPPATFTASGPTVVVLAIGEAARAGNFALYGYDRPTNPRLTALGAVPLADTTSCATYTTAAVGCILSPMRSGSSDYEPLPNYLYRSGVDVIWRANNWGEPPHLEVATYQRARELREGCEGPGCDHDEVLLNGLAERISTSDHERVFVVLHMRGSHGPAYYSEYPPRFEVFRPVCESVDLSECSRDALVNAYDNTILYTDYVLGLVIEMLRGMPDTPSALLYLSDHGESLGEYGLYLHGTPWTIAPDVQKIIPFLVWTSEAFRAREGISMDALARQAHHSQANVFHSVMGAFDMTSDVYDPTLDVFAAAGDREAIQAAQP